MRHLLLSLTLLMVLSANKCTKGGGSASLMDTKWVLRSLLGGAVEMPAGAELPWLQLTADGLQGYGGCNRLMGQYQLDGAKLSFPGVGSTKMYCENTMETENALKTALGMVDSYKLEGGLLKLMGNGREVAVLAPETM